MAEATATSSEPLHESDLSGRQLGDYSLLRRLGSGGMADVYLAEQSSLRRKVALKVLKAALARDASYVRRFHVEAQAAAGLIQANIVQIYEVGRADDLHYIAQEYVRGKNLKQLVQKRGAVSAPLALNIMRQVAAALHKASEQGVTHRDIKPENIMLSAEGEVKVADFGLARVTGNGRAADITQVGMTMGTPLYMSPEQVEGREVDPRSDIYSFGVMCFHMLAGHPPFQGDTPLSIAVQHLQRDPIHLSTIRPELPAELCRIVHKAFAKTREERYQKPADLLRDLRAIKVEGTDEEWPADLNDWSTAELLAVERARNEATQQLSTLMRSERRMSLPRRRWLVWVLSLPALALVAFLVGATAAVLLRPPDVIGPGPEPLAPGAVPRKESAREQYVYAALKGTEAAWNSVEGFFPAEENKQNEYYARRAKQRLAELHLRRGKPGDLKQALGIFDEFAALGAAEREFQLYGKAGQAIVYDRQGDKDKAVERLFEVVQDLDELKGQMKTEIEQLYEKYRGESGA